MLFSDLVGPCARQDQGSSSWPYTLLDVDPTTCKVPRHSSDAVCYSVRTVAVRKRLCLNSPTTIRWLEWLYYYYYYWLETRFHGSNKNIDNYHYIHLKYLNLQHHSSENNAVLCATVVVLKTTRNTPSSCCCQLH